MSYLYKYINYTHVRAYTHTLTEAQGQYYLIYFHQSQTRLVEIHKVTKSQTLE